MNRFSTGVGDGFGGHHLRPTTGQDDIYNLARGDVM